jgi:hypothetical protein
VASWGHNPPPPIPPCRHPRPHRRARVSKGGHCLPVSRICAPHGPPGTSQIRDSGGGTKIIRKCTTSWLGCPVDWGGGALSQKTGHFTAPRCLLPHLRGCRAKNETRNVMSAQCRRALEAFVWLRQNSVGCTNFSSNQNPPIFLFSNRLCQPRYPVTSGHTPMHWHGHTCIAALSCKDKETSCLVSLRLLTKKYTFRHS